MDNRRLFLFAALVFVAFLIYQAWMRDYGPKPPPVQTPPTAASSAPAPASVPAIPTAPGPAASPASNSSNPAAVAAATSANQLPTGKQIEVRTDVLDVRIDTLGGDIREAQLLKYPLELNQPQRVKVIDSNPEDLLITQSGLQTHSGPAAPNLASLYTATRDQYQLAPGEKTLTVVLTWKDRQGLEVEKTYTFTRGSYQIGLAYSVHNASSQAWSGAQYLQFENHYVQESHSLFSVHRYDYQRVAFHGSDGYQELEFKDLDKTPLNKTTAGGWISVVNHYFLAAAIPMSQKPSGATAGQQPAGAAENLYYTRALGNSNYSVGTITSVKTVAPGGQAIFADKFFIGPKLQTRLAEVAPGLELTVDYGKLTIIAEPIFKLLNLIHRFIGNWGWSILVLTLLFKLLFYPLNQISGRSMAKMRRVQPRLKALQERYKDDRARLGQATMEFYKKEKINPMGGCLPMLVQMPIFFALFYVLIYSVELRQSPWLGWIHDLSAPDPYYILPILYCAVFFIQQRISPQPTTDKMQQRIMMFMPLGIGVLYAVLPSGLALYYVANSILTIAQQWRINSVVGMDNKKHAAKTD
ncbi:MAG: membrane protein insertase YidC [Gammaproteobacteria bacterium]|nr:membrane protein insertase YidC [Gammaproteobacteria bacterium]